MEYTTNGLFSIPLGAHFIHWLAKGVLERYGADPLALARVKILVPNRRSARLLEEALLEYSGKGAILLPTIVPIGDIAEEEVEWGLVDELAQNVAIAPAISPTRRRLLLAGLIRSRAGDGTMMQHPHALKLADDLARFLDEMQREHLDFSALHRFAEVADMLDPEREFVHDMLSEHWKKTLDFMEILSVEWPEILEREGVLDPVDRRNRLLEYQAASWQECPPDTPVIAAGSTGSNKAAAALLGVIARLPQGALILPGLSRSMQEIQGRTLDAAHPLYGIQQMLERTGLQSEDVQSWWQEDVVRESRGCLWKQVLCPPGEVQAWQMAQVPEGALDGLEMLEVQDAQEQAEIVSLILRDTLETPEATAALVTQDRELAQRVSLLMRRYGVVIDDTAGQKLERVPWVHFALLVAEMAASRAAPVPLLAMIKHSLMRGSESTLFARKIEMLVLRSVRVSDGLPGIMESLQNRLGDEDPLLQWFKEIQGTVEPFSRLFLSEKVALRDVLAEHHACVSALTDERDETVEAVWESLQEAAQEDTQIDPEDYLPILRQLLAGQMMRPKWGMHPRLHILSPMEARLHHYDQMVLAGLNDGSWPIRGQSAWMSNAMREAFGLPSMQRQQGQAAHDFLMAAMAPKVMLIRPTREGNAPATASAWWVRLEAYLKAHNLSDQVEPRKAWREWVAELHQQHGKFFQSRPVPNPPLSTRPDQVSVSLMKCLMENPYAYYAKEILRLKKLDELDMEPGAREFGNLIHNIMEHYCNGAIRGEEGMRLAVEKVLADWQHRPTALRMWQPRMEALISWLSMQDGNDRQDAISVYAEKDGQQLLKIAQDFSVKIHARADRITQLPGNKCRIIDYKTGKVSSKRRVAEARDPQMSVLGWLVSQGAFDGLSVMGVSALDYWDLGKNAEDSKVIPVLKDVVGKQGAEAVWSEVEQGMAKILGHFLAKEVPFICCPVPDFAPDIESDDYALLARRKAWQYITLKNENTSENNYG